MRGGGGSSEDVYGQRVECVGGSEAGSIHRSSSPSDKEYNHSSAYMVCVKGLLSNFTEENLSVSIR